jgi:hypothetical protein
MQAAKSDILVFHKQPRRTNDVHYRIRCSVEAFNAVDAIASATNLTAAEVASAMILYASNHYTVREE